jgi:hypothetical protein
VRPFRLPALACFLFTNGFKRSSLLPALRAVQLHVTFTETFAEVAAPVDADVPFLSQVSLALSHLIAVHLLIPTLRFVDINAEWRD